MTKFRHSLQKRQSTSILPMPSNFLQYFGSLQKSWSQAKVGNPTSTEFYDASETHILLFFSNQNEGKKWHTSIFLGVLNCLSTRGFIDTKFWQTTSKLLSFNSRALYWHEPLSDWTSNLLSCSSIPHFQTCTPNSISIK